MCKHAVKKLPFVIRYVFDQYSTEQMCDKAILENGGKPQFVYGCYKYQQMCDKTVDNYPQTLKVVSDFYKTQKSVIQFSILLILQYNFVHKCNKTHEMC